MRAGDDEDVSVGRVVAEGVGGDAGDVGVVADDVAHRPGADRRKLGVAVPQLAVDVGVRKEVPANKVSISNKILISHTREQAANDEGILACLPV